MPTAGGKPAAEPGAGAGEKGTDGDRLGASRVRDRLGASRVRAELQGPGC